MIPSILWQTAKSKTDTIPFSKHINSWRIYNPTINIRFMNDIMCENFIRDNFSDEVFFVYTSLPLGVMRADMWRIAIIYIYGGIYADVDTVCHTPIDLLLVDKNIVIAKEFVGLDNVANYFFAATPNHPVFKRTLDIMIEKFNHAFISNSLTHVQDFGMGAFAKAAQEFKIDFIESNEMSIYVEHLCAGSWRNAEKEYVNTMNNTPITFFTTFNESGYSLYGATWIQTFIKNVVPRGANIKAKIYTHGFKLNIKHPQIELIDYDETFPEHAKWKEEFRLKASESQSEYIKNMTIRFSHKGFVINHALQNIKDGYAIWLDGDCVMHDVTYDMFPKNLLSNASIACQVENTDTDRKHVESGILLFDMNNPDIEKFKLEFSKNYSIEEVLKMPEAYDGFIVYKSLINCKINFNNLNEVYGITGIQSCPTLTFLHPEIKKRFTHNIGPGGKSNYDNWEIVKRTDSIFQQISGMMPISEKDSRIMAMKHKRSLLKTIINTL